MGVGVGGGKGTVPAGGWQRHGALAGGEIDIRVGGGGMFTFIIIYFQGPIGARPSLLYISFSH